MSRVVRVVKLRVKTSGNGPRLEVDPPRLGANFGDIVRWETEPHNEEVAFAIDFEARGSSPFIWMKKKSAHGMVIDNEIAHDPDHSGSAIFVYSIAAVTKTEGLIFADPDIQVPKPSGKGDKS